MAVIEIIELAVFGVAVLFQALTGSDQAIGVDLIDPPLMERSAFSALFEFGGNLRNMPAQGNMDGAIENAARFAQAVYKRLTGEV